MKMKAADLFAQCSHSISKMRDEDTRFLIRSGAMATLRNPQSHKSLHRLAPSLDSSFPVAIGRTSGYCPIPQSDPTCTVRPCSIGESSRAIVHVHIPLSPIARSDSFLSNRLPLPINRVPDLHWAVEANVAVVVVISRFTNVT